MTDKIRVAINGLGRIGRHLLRKIILDPRYDIVFLNDPNMSPENLIYLLKYDSTYGRMKTTIKATNEGIFIDKKYVKLFSFDDPIKFKTTDEKIDIILESSGIKTLGNSFKKLIDAGITKKIICTYSNNEFTDGSFVVGVNDKDYDNGLHHFISGTICDVVALSPILKAVLKQSNIAGGSLVTLHPWLSYQNLVDGPVASVSSPGHAWPDFALGRASIDNLIPKNTTALSVLADIYPDLPYSKLQSMSFRIPTATVTSSIINLRLNNSFSVENFHDELRKNSNLEVVSENLVSKDFVGSSFGASVDMRWTSVCDSQLRVIAWYDNEYGYSSQIIKLVERIFDA